MNPAKASEFMILQNVKKFFKSFILAKKAALLIMNLYVCR
jgi:hypothetical protein